jgi:hypothetical protein
LDSGVQDGFAVELNAAVGEDFILSKGSRDAYSHAVGHFDNHKTWELETNFHRFLAFVLLEHLLLTKLMPFFDSTPVSSLSLYSIF